ncbi:MAG: hypothetical protein IVW57_00205 [Ktedonobacterales bacterium]|nr:hypothetical protein [Ktedonobacterales bacterium]
MALRSSNNPIPSKVLLGQIRQIIPAGTLLQTANPADTTGVAQVFVRQRYAMVRQNIWPAVNLSTGQQQFNVVSRAVYEGMAVVIIEYYLAWPQSPETIDQLLQDTDDDLERIRANLEDNPTLSANKLGPYAVSMPACSVSPDKGEIDSTFGPELVKRTITARFLLLPYETAGTF